MPIVILSESEVEAALPVKTALESQRVAYRAVVDSSARMSASAMAVDPDDDALTFALTGMIAGSTGVVCKFGTQRPANAALGLPSVQAFVLVTDATTGAPLACLNGTAITTLRTSAGLGVAADLLAPAHAKRLAVLGSGVQAACTVRMIAAVRALESVVISSPTEANRERLAASLRAELGLEVTATASAEEAVRGADIVATCTLSRTPVVEGAWLHPGQTVLTMGSYEAGRRETDLEVTRRASVVLVDDAAKCAAQCGPVIEGELTAAELVEIGTVLTGAHPGRTSDDEIVLFHSMGVGLQDAAAAAAAFETARALGLGTSVDF